MTADVQFWYGFIAALVALGAVVGWLARSGRLPATNGEGRMAREQLAAQIDALRKTVTVLQDDHVRDVQRITQLERELAEAKERIRYLEGRLERYETAGDDEPRGDFPLLALFGPDQRIVTADLAALRQSRVPFKRILNATQDKIADELQRRRDAGDLYRWLHIGAHADPAGLDLADGVAGREFWNAQLSGLEGVFLSGCTDVAVADWLVGLVDWVFSTHEDIPLELAGRFAKAFWEALGAGKAPRSAYQLACKAVPQFAEYTDFRERRR